MKGVFIFNEKNDLLYWYADDDVRNYLQRQLEVLTRKTNSSTDLGVNIFDKTTLSYVFLPLITAFRAYKTIFDDCYRRIWTNDVCVTFGELQNLLFVSIFSSNSSRRQIFHWNETLRSIMLFVFGVFFHLLGANELKIQNDMLTILITNYLRVKDSNPIYVNANGMINKNKSETDYFAENIGKELAKKFWSNSTCFVINDKQLLSIVDKGELTQKLNFQSVDFQKILYLLSDWPSNQDKSKINHFIVMINDQYSKIRSPWILIRWELSTNVYFAFLTPLGFKDVSRCLNELFSFVSKEFNDDSPSLSWWKSVIINNLLIHLEKAVRYYQQASNVVRSLKSNLNSLSVNFGTKTSSTSFELVLDMKLGQCKKLLRNLLLNLWQQVCQTGNFCLTEFLEKHLVDLKAQPTFEINLKTCLAELPPTVFQGPSPSAYFLDMVCYFVKFHGRNVVVSFEDENWRWKTFTEIETVTKRLRMKSMFKNENYLTIVLFFPSFADSYTVVAIFEPFTNEELAWNESVTLGQEVSKLVTDTNCSFARHIM